MAAVTLAFVAVAARLVARPRRWHVEALGALLALSFATKEATFLHVPIGIAAGLAWFRLRGPGRLRGREIPLRWWLSGAVVFVLVFVILFGDAAGARAPGRARLRRAVALVAARRGRGDRSSGGGARVEQRVRAGPAPERPARAHDRRADERRGAAHRRRSAPARRAGGAAGRPRPTIEVDPNYGSASPWSWYLRGMPAGYPDMAADGYVPRGDVLIVTAGSRAILGPRLRGYEGRPFVMRGRRPPMGTGFTAARLRAVVRAPDAVGAAGGGARVALRAPHRAGVTELPLERPNPSSQRLRFIPWE